jgi:hypothetical protein
VFTDQFFVWGLATADRAQNVPFGDDAWTGLLLVDDDGSSNAAFGHPPCGITQGVFGSDCKDDGGHRVAHMQDASSCIRNK